MHQEGKRKGYRSESKEIASTEIKTIAGRFPHQLYINGENVQGFRAAPNQAAIDEEIRRWRNRKPEGVPPAPFSKSWPLLAMKRMIRMAAESGSPGNTAWLEVTKPNSIRSLAENILGREMLSVSPLNSMEASVLSLWKHDQIGKAIIKSIPVNVVDYLSNHSITAKQLIGNPSMVVKSLPVDGRTIVSAGLRDSLVKVGTRLRAALESTLVAGRDAEILPTLNASNLNAREVVWALSPVTSSDLSDHFRPAKTGTTAATKSSVPDAQFGRPSNELSAADLASLLNSHERIITGNPREVNRYVAPSDRYEKIAWANGTMQAERYDLSKQVEAIRYAKATGGEYDGQYAISVLKKGAAWDDSWDGIGMFSAEKLPDVIGKDIAAKIVAGQGTASSEGTGDMKYFSGLDLKVGGEGMKGFYDQILPAEVNKYVKKWGGRVSETKIQVGGNTKETESAFPNEGISREVTAYRPKSIATVPSIDITPSMREEVIYQGQELHEPEAKYGNDKLSAWMKSVEQAIAEGKPVPQRVIDDFLKRGGKVAGKTVAPSLAKTTEEVTASLVDFIERTPKAGLSIADMTRNKKANDDVKMPGAASLKSVNEKVEWRWQKSKGITQKGMIEKIKEHAHDIAELRKTFLGLDYKADAKVINILREFGAVPEYSKHMAAETTAGILAGLGPKKYDIFTRNVILPDIIRDIESGLLTDEKLPFGYQSVSEVQADHDKFKSLADANPDIKAALDRREKFQAALSRELVNADLLPKEVLADPRYFHHQVLQYMEIKKAHPGTSSKDVRVHKKGFQRGRVGSSLDYNTEYIEAEFEYVAQALSQLKTKEIVDRIGKAVDISKKVRADAESKGLKDWRDAIPEGYTTWQPKSGTQWYKTMSVPQRVIEEVLAGTREMTEADVKEVIAMAGRKKEWVIPENVATVLDNFRDFSKDEGFDRFVRSVMATWKQWVLLNPVRVLKYNINNMSGDLDIALAYDPKILKYFKAAAEEAWASKNGAAMTADMRKAMELGITSSGFSIQEIPDIKDIGFFKVLLGNDKNVIERYWEQTKELTQFRENILRIAAFKYFRERLKRGEKNVYGVSRPELVDAETDIDRKAAMLARELVGDYGNISQAGQWLRQRMIPFWSWAEINAPRYMRLIRNASYEGREGGAAGAAGKAAGVMGKKAAFKVGKVLLQANILMALIMAWNAIAEKALDMDDDEKRALYDDRRQLQLILSRADDGTIRTFRFQGALSDALDWMALGNWPDVLRDMMSGKTAVGEQLKEMAKAPVNKIINSSHPILKTVAEVMTGRQLYPDIFNSRPIRDKTEHVARLVSMDMPYRYLTGKPTRGISTDILLLVTYANDPGERTYWAARKLTFDYLEKQGKEFPSSSPTDKSNALYYFKQAKRYKDEKAVEKFLGKYVELGGSVNGMRDSLKRGAPLAAIPAIQRSVFRRQLLPDERRMVNLAEKWYNTHMQLTSSDIASFWKFKKQEGLKK